MNVGDASFMLIGPIEAGKSTLFKAIFDLPEEVHKTQAVEFETGCIDTPGEFFSHPRLYHALINSASDIGTLVYVHPCNEEEFRLPPGFLDIYEDKRLVGVITKTDLPGATPADTEKLLRENGFTGPIFRVSNTDPQSIENLKTFLLGNDAAGNTDSRSDRT